MGLETSPWWNLAQAVFSELGLGRRGRLNIKILARIFEAMYFSSLRTEELQPITVHIVYLDPASPDPAPPSRIRHDRWQYIPFGDPVPLTVANLVKLAKASDPRTSSFVVYPNEKGSLFLWGLVDQGNSYFNLATHSAESGFPRPGIFQASILDAGKLVAYVGSSQVAELDVSLIRTRYSDVLRRGPLFACLLPAIERYATKVYYELEEPPSLEDSASVSWLLSYLADYWISTLCRLLLRIQSHKHGGALLITPESLSSGLNIKHRIFYPRLRSSLHTCGVLKVKKRAIVDEVFNEYLDKNADFIPVDLYLDKVVCEDDLFDSRDEVDGAVWFVSLLTRVDGVVLMTPDLEVGGFGVEITFGDEPLQIFQASDHNAKRLKKMSYTHYGTRHRSMMRYCSKIPGSVGFVISQDGDLRVMTLLEEKLVIWENIRLRLEDFSRRKAPRSKRRSKGTGRVKRSGKSPNSGAASGG